MEKFDHTKIPHEHFIVDGKEICIRLDTKVDDSGKKYTEKQIQELRKGHGSGV